MRTPRPHAPVRGIGTLIGNGWLRESPKNRAPAFWEVRSRSALRKCMFMNVPRELLEALPEGALVPSTPPRIVAPNAAPAYVDDGHVKRRDPERDVRMIPAFDPQLARRVVREQQRREEPFNWVPPPIWESPVAVGVLLMLAPPIGLAALWSSKRYSGDARWALTIMTALMMCLAAAVAITAMSLRF